ncbi:DUF1631 domain-containing protein [Kaarinaea lacus]
MAEAHNVINFTVSGNHGSPITGSIPELLKSSKRIANKQLRARMETMFNNVDDCLFEYADKAENNQQQMLYFDAMRDIRINKSAMIDRFFQAFEQQFDQFFSRGGTSRFPQVSINSSGGSLGLVEDDDLEESLAITNMASRVYAECRESLSAMVQRMNEVYPQGEFTKEENPLSPKQLCDACAQAIGVLEAELEIKLIVYKLFDKFVIQNIVKLYEEVNQIFVAAGVLPTIKYKVPVNNSIVDTRVDYLHDEVLAEIGSGVNAAETTASANTGANLTANATVFDTMRAALYQYRGGQPVAAGVESTAVTDVATGLDQGSAPIGQYYISDDIISGLSMLQNNVNSEVNSDINAGVNALDQDQQASGEIVKAQLLQTIQQNTKTDTTLKIENTHADVIDIVSMLFDFILNDKTLPQAIKAQIARLQIPMVKVALLDKAFFSTKTHAARQLLNELAYASNTLNGEFDADDTLLRQVGHVVDRILSEFDSDVKLFEELLLEFRDFVEKEIEANKMAEDMILQVKDNVAAEIERRMKNKRIPVPIKEFLLGPWKEVLKIVGIRDACEGMAWNIAVSLVDDLIWSVQPKIVVKERQQLSILIPKILQALQEGLILICYEQQEIDSFFQQLQILHLQSMRLDSALNNTVSAQKAVVSESQSQPSQDDEDGFMEEFVLQSDKHDSYEFDIADPELKRSEYFNAVKDMVMGTWLEFKTSEGVKRGKLTWKCDFTGEYTFMDRMYKLVADIGMRDLIVQLEQGTVTIIDDLPLFERAVDAVISGMKNCVSGKVDSRETVLN